MAAVMIQKNKMDMTISFLPRAAKDKYRRKRIVGMSPNRVSNTIMEKMHRTIYGMGWRVHY